MNPPHPQFPAISVTSDGLLDVWSTNAPRQCSRGALSYKYFQKSLNLYDNTGHRWNVTNVIRVQKDLPFIGWIVGIWGDIRSTPIDVNLIFGNPKTFQLGELQQNLINCLMRDIGVYTQKCSKASAIQAISQVESFEALIDALYEQGVLEK